MKTLILALFAVAVTFVAADEANAQRRFLFPNIAANRANAQARANIAVANANASIAVAQASRNGVFFAPQVAVVKANHGFNNVFVPRNSAVFLAAPSYGYQQQFVQQQFVPSYSQQFVQSYQPSFALQPLAIPSYSRSVQFSVSGGGGYCGF